jgi:hypothetical protein
MGTSSLVSRYFTPAQPGLFFKIQDSEISIELAGGVIVGLSGGNLIGKIADLLSLAIDPNRGSPFLGLFVVPDASVF